MPVVPLAIHSQGAAVSVVTTLSANELDLICDALVALYLRGREPEVMAFAAAHPEFPFFTGQNAPEEDL